MKTRLTEIIICLLLCSCSHGPAEFYVITTTDLHGALNSNMSSIYSYINNARAEYGDNLIVLDCGDNVQGSPQAYFSNYVDYADSSIFAKLFNELQYDAISVGNHDVELESETDNKFYSRLDAPIICANIVDSQSGKPVFKPYSILQKGKYKIALLGLCGTESLKWLSVSLSGNLKFEPMIESAKYWMKQINKIEHPDLVIGLFHTGCAPEDRESAYQLAQEVPGLALCFCGHLHKCDKESVINAAGDSVKLVSTDDKGRHIALATIKMQPERFGKVKASVSTEIVPIEGYATSQEFYSLISSFQLRADQYFNVPITSIGATIYSNDALIGPCPWTSMLHRAFRKMTEKMGYVNGKSVTATIVSPSQPNAVLNKGPLTPKDIISIYPYENTMSIIEMTGSEIKDYLEYAYSLLLDYPNNPIYVFDTVSGFEYTVDVSKPYGSRISMVAESTGHFFSPSTFYRVAMSTFRASGGNGYLTRGLGWSEDKMKARTIEVSNQSILSMLMGMFSENPLDITAVNDWSYL